MSGISPIQAINKFTDLGFYPEMDKKLSIYYLPSGEFSAIDAANIINKDFLHISSLTKIDFENLKNFISMLPANIQGIKFGFCHFIRDLTIKQKIALLNSIPSDVIYLNFSGCNFFGNVSADKIISILKAIPRTIKYLGLFDELKHINVAGLTKVTAAIPSSVAVVGIGYRYLKSDSAKEIIAFYNSFKTEIYYTHGLYGLRTSFEEKVNIFSSEFDKKTSINLETKMFEFDKPNNPAVENPTLCKQLLRSIATKPKINEINLGTVCFYIGHAFLSSVLNEIPATIESVLVSFYLPADDMPNVINLMPANITKLHINFNAAFGEEVLTSTKLIQAIQQLPVNIQTLGLSGNINDYNLVLDIIENLPPNIKQLKLEDGYTLSISQLSDMIKKIKIGNFQKISLPNIKFSPIKDNQIYDLIELCLSTASNGITIEFKTYEFFKARTAVASKLGSWDYILNYSKVAKVIHAYNATGLADNGILLGCIESVKPEIINLDTINYLRTRVESKQDPIASILHGIYCAKQLLHLHNSEMQANICELFKIADPDELSINMANQAFLSYIHAIEIDKGLTNIILPLINQLKFMTPMLLPRNKWTEGYFSDASNELYFKINSYLDQEEFNKHFADRGWNFAPLNHMSDLEIIHQLKLLFNQTYDELSEKISILNKVHEILDIAESKYNRDLMIQVSEYLHSKSADLTSLDDMIVSDDPEQMPSKQILARIEVRKTPRKRIKLS